MPGNAKVVKYPVHVARITPRAIAALIDAGNTVERCSPSLHTYLVTLRKPISGLCVCVVPKFKGAEWTDDPVKSEPIWGIRLEDDERFSVESMSMWFDRMFWLACPECGEPLLWPRDGKILRLGHCMHGHAVEMYTPPVGRTVLQRRDKKFDIECEIVG